MAVGNQNKNIKGMYFSSNGDNYLPFIIFLVILCTLILQNNIFISIKKLVLNRNWHINLKLLQNSYSNTSSKIFVPYYTFVLW